jgi:predicted phage-related endonuclease
VLRSVDHPWALASLDYWTGEGNERWPLEIKNVNAFLAEDWINGTPDYYIAQLQQQMLVTGAERGTSACLLGGNRLLWCDVDRDIVMVRKIVHNGGTFWDRVVRRDPPEPDDSEATRKVLNRLYPQDDASTVELPMALLEIVDEWRVVKAEIKAREDRSRHLENQIKATMGDAQIGVFPGGDRVSWKTQRVKEHVVKAGTKRPLLYHPAKET